MTHNMYQQQVFRSLLTLVLGIHVCIARIDIVFENHTDVYVEEGQELDLNVTLLVYNGSESTIIFQSLNENEFEIINASTYSVSAGMVLPRVYHVKIRGHNLGLSSIVIMMSGVGSNEMTRVAEIPVKILLVANYFYDNILNYLFFVPISITYCLMGFTLDIKLVLKNLKRPFAVFIGFTCQFVLMPALAFGIGKMLQLEPTAAIGLLLVGCSPGGKLSNDLSILVDADFVLSVTMTTCSTLLALGTMPLNIFIYTPFISDSSIETPYDQVAIQLVAMLIPLAAGVLARLRWSHYEKKALKIMKPVIAVVLILIIGSSLPFQIYIFYSPWQIYVSSLLLPLIGGTLGAIMAKLARLKKEQIATIAFETGVQNAIIAYVVLINAYPKPEADLAGRVPFIGLMLQFFLGMAVIGIYTLHKRFVFKEDKEPVEDKVEIAIDSGTYRSTSDSTVLKDDVNAEIQQPTDRGAVINLAVEDTEF